MRIALTRAQIDVLFHVVNNTYGDSFAAAAVRGAECDGMSHEAFCKAFGEVSSLLANADAIELVV